MSRFTGGWWLWSALQRMRPHGALAWRHEALRAAAGTSRRHGRICRLCWHCERSTAEAFRGLSDGGHKRAARVTGMQDASSGAITWTSRSASSSTPRMARHPCSRQRGSLRRFGGYRRAAEGSLGGDSTQASMWKSSFPSAEHGTHTPCLSPHLIKQLLRLQCTLLCLQVGGDAVD